jgi:hypothetical protein
MNKPSPRLDALRAMREANFERDRRESAQNAKKTRQPKPPGQTTKAKSKKAK